jgi:hypothetical protein
MKPAMLSIFLGMANPDFRYGTTHGSDATIEAGSDQRGPKGEETWGRFRREIGRVTK